VASRSSASSSLLLLDEVLKDLMPLRFEAGVDFAGAVALEGVEAMEAPLLEALLRDSFRIF
jgi:hypothetical protein